jgi:hypothetical protein
MYALKEQVQIERPRRRGQQSQEQVHASASVEQENREESEGGTEPVEGKDEGQKKASEELQGWSGLSKYWKSRVFVGVCLCLCIGFELDLSWI